MLMLLFSHYIKGLRIKTGALLCYTESKLMFDEHNKWMETALEEARLAYEAQEAPIGAIAVLNDKIIARAHNKRESFNDPTAHAEIMLLREAAGNLANWRLSRVKVYVTLEPCTMCAGALVLARVNTLVYGTPDPKAGAVHSLYNILEDKRLNHRVEVVSGVKEAQCRKILQDFFKERRACG